MSHIKIGALLPSFALLNQNENLVSIDEIRKGKNLVLYFYPKDETLVCTKEACAFRDSYTKFEGNNCVIIGISADSPTSHKSFIKSHNLPFTLLSDQENEVRNLLGVPRDILGLLSRRYTYVIKENGIIVHIFNDHFSASKHINESLKALVHEQAINH